MTDLGFSRPLPAWLVHRAAIAEVFVTAASARDADRFEVAAQLPRYHAFYHDAAGDDPPDPDPLAVIEVFRQASIVVAHEFYGAPLAAHFLWRGVDMRVLDADRLRPRGAPVNLIARCEALRAFTGPRGTTGLLLRAEATVGGVVAASAELSFSWLGEAAWNGLRASARAEHGLAPETGAPVRAASAAAAVRVGRRNPANVVISALGPGADSDRTADLVVDLDHPTMFDHPLDHLPGTLLLEALRQFAIALTDGPPRRVRALSARFEGFAELDLPAHCSGRFHDRDLVRVAVVQNGRRLLEGRVELTGHGAGRAAPAAAVPAGT